MTRIFNQVVFTLIASAALASAQQPILRLSTTTVAATVSQGSNAPNQSVLAYNIGTGTLSIGAASTAPWVQIALTPSAACTQSTNGCFPIVLTFNTSSLAAGTYSALIEVTDANAVDAPQAIAVSLTVASVPSTLTFYAPPSGQAPTATFYTHGPATTQASTATGGPWLSVQLETTTAASFVPYQVTASSANISTPGTYTGSIVVSGSDNASDNHSIPVTFNVTTSPIAQLSISALNIPLGQNQQQSIPITIGNIGNGSLTVSGATAATTTGSGWLTAALAGGSVTVTLNTASLSPGAYSGSVTITTNAANNGGVLTVPVTLLVTQQTGPQISIGGVVDGAAYQPTLSPGDIAAAFGLGLSSSTLSATTLPLPSTLNQTSVLVNGEAAPLYFTSTGQVNFQVPYEIPSGLATVQMVNGSALGNTVSVNVVSRAPRIPLISGIAPVIINYGDNSIPVVTNPALSIPSHPAALGDTLIIYAFGLGETDPIATDGAAASDSPLLQIDPPVNVMLTGGGVFGQSVQVTPLFAGLVPGLAGLYQINFTIPKNAPTGNSIELTVNVKGGSTNPVNIAIQ
jgi:uncharacterized protein (TIGR03437 family)